MRMKDKPQAREKASPTPRHPFSLAFSPRRMTQPDFDKRTPPAKPKSRAASTVPPERLPWHERPLPPDWTADEVLFFTNWRNELEHLHQTLLVAATDRTKLLRKARSIYFKLAYRLTERIRETATHSPGDSAKALRP